MKKNRIETIMKTILYILLFPIFTIGLITRITGVLIKAFGEFFMLNVHQAKRTLLKVFDF